MPASTTTTTNLPHEDAGETLTVAVTGAGGTIGPSLIGRLAECGRVGRVVLLGRHRTPEMGDHDFREVDVRDARSVDEAITGADVVVHLAFALYGLSLGERELFATNVQGTANVARAAVRAGARRFIYTSSAAVYGPREDQSELLGEEEPLKAGTRLFYARHKAQAELVVAQALAGSDIELYMFRPCAIVGPHASGAAAARIPSVLKKGGRLGARIGLRPLLAAPSVPLQYVHEDDVAQAIELAVEGRGRPGVYNLAGEGTVSGADSLRLLGLHNLPVPGALVGASLRAFRAVPPVIPALAWPELVSGSLLVDPTKARRELGWQPHWTSAEALAATRDGLGY